MDYREPKFGAKFEDAARQLGTVPHQVESLKLREHVEGDHAAQYRQLLQALANEAGLKSTPANGNSRGNGHVVENSKTKIILEEHESGLEIFYIAGSIASLVGLIPLVLKCWSAIREHNGRHHHGGPERMEARRLGIDGKLVEEHSHAWASPWGIHSFSTLDNAVFLATEKIDTELDGLRQALGTLTARIEALESKALKPSPTRKPRVRKKQAKDR